MNVMGVIMFDLERIMFSMLLASAIIAAGVIAWRVLELTLTWFDVTIFKMRSDANMIAPDERGLLPVARQLLEAGALVPGVLGLVNPALVRPDERGLLPVHQSLVDSNVIAEQVLQLLASHLLNGRPQANVPSSISYAPHMIYKNDIKAEGGAEVPALPAFTPKSFLELFQAGALPKDKFVMGYDLESGAIVEATWRQLYSALIGGQSGAGKSTLIRNILAQSALQGGRFVVLDPHYASGEESLGQSLSPLRSLMLCDVAANEKQMADALRFVSDIGQRRLHGEDGDRTPLILVVDETTALLSRNAIKTQLLDVLGMIAQETRKVGVYAMAIGQNFKGEIFDTTARNSFVSMLSCRARKDVARVQSGNSEFADIAESLTIGQCVWMQPSGDVTKIAVPNCTEQMIDVVARTIEKTPKTQPPALLEVDPLTKPLTEPLTTPLTTVSEGKREWIVGLTAKQQNAIQMYLDGASKSQIIADLWGAKGGPPFQAASAEFDEALRHALKGGA